MFAVEMSRFLFAQGDHSLSKVDGGLFFLVPEGVRDVLGRPLRRLSHDCQELLTVASVIGREFSRARLPTHVSENRSLDGCRDLAG